MSNFGKIKFILIKTGHALKRKHSNQKVENLIHDIHRDRYSSCLTEEELLRVLDRIFQQR